MNITITIFLNFISLLDTNSIDFTSRTSGSDYASEVEDTNKVLLERNSRETSVRFNRSYDSVTPLERPIFATSISDRTVTENSSSVKFTCSLLSTECDISWDKNGIPIRPSSKYTQTFADGLAILEIFDVNDEDAGKYTCRANNKFGESVTSARLKVYSGFKPSVSMPPTVMRQMKGRKKIFHHSKERETNYNLMEQEVSLISRVPLFYVLFLSLSFISFLWY